MMAKITKGGSFGGAVKYVMDERKSANMIDSNGVQVRDVESIIQSFEMQAELNPRVTKPVGHISLNFSAQDYKRLDDALMAKIAREYMMKMGILDTQYIVGRHHDKIHPHCHIIFNRVDLNGRTISDANDRVHSTKICRELTEKYGLYVASGKERVKRHRLNGNDATKYKIYDSLVRNIPLSKSWAELDTRLHREGIEAGFKTKGSTSQIEGVRFTADNITFNGSKIDRQFSFSKIDYALKQNLRAEQREAEPEYVQKWQPAPVAPIEQEQEQSEGLIENLLGLLDLSNGSEEVAAAAPEKKKKRKEEQFKMRF
ncbi:MAG: relaxase/mobilization nuclease domain-containing protein [Rikenellaceae bacterium]